jgi:hypothetical protein
MEHSMSSLPRQQNRWAPLFQPTIIRIYKLAGVVALSLILVGLASFVTVNIVYFFNRSWVRPVILSADNSRVIEATTRLSEARLKVTQLESEAQEATMALAETDRIIVSSDKFLADVGNVAPKNIASAESALLRRQIDQAALERSNALDRKVALGKRVKDLAARIDDERAIVGRVSGSAYVRALEQKIAVAFVPYQNLGNVEPGAPLYGCTLNVLGCSQIGKVVKIIEGEVQDFHPHDNSLQRGVMLEIQVGNLSDAEARVLFVGKKPLWIF